MFKRGTWTTSISTAAGIALMSAAFLVGCADTETPDDEALAAARARAAETGAERPSAEDVGLTFYPRKIDNYFKGMDSVALMKEPSASDDPLSPLDVPVSQLVDKKPVAFRVEDPLRTESEILGRNTWVVWCGGNEGFWDWLAGYGGLTDLLKLVDSRDRATRFNEAGVINEPDMVRASGPDRFGLWLDTPATPKRRTYRDDYVKYAFDGEGEYVYDSEIPPPRYYGLSSGVVGLRLFPNPNFIANKDNAQEKWDGERYYTDRDYFTDPKLIRPYRVGMSCGFCHVSWHPLNPPRDIGNPRWENISGNIGAQYLRIRSVFGNLIENDENFLYHVLDSQPPGTIDTSLIPSDNINNTNAMNSVFNLSQRVVTSMMNPRETQSPVSTRTQPSLWGNPKAVLSRTYPEAGADEPYAPRTYDEKTYDKLPYDLEPYTAEEDKVPEQIWKLFENLELLDDLRDSNESPRHVARILFDGADSIGAWGALARVYLNIGTYWEQWERLHTPLIGFTPQKPFTIADCEEHSAYWHATQLRVGPMRDYFLRISPPMALLATEGAEARLEPIDKPALRRRAMEEVAFRKTPPAQRAAAEQVEYDELLIRERGRRIDVDKLPRGRQVFAENCIICHSSVQPELFFVEKDDDQRSGQLRRLTAFFEEEAGALQTKYADLIERRHTWLEELAGPPDNELWYHNPGQWLTDPAYKAWAREVVELPGFWRLNYLSVDYRIPVNLVGTNSARAMATNGMLGNMWSDFTSSSYQHMPSVGAIDFFNPYLGEEGGMDQYSPRHKVRDDPDHPIPEGGGGPGFYRVPSLVSIWTTAPLLHNNSLGHYIDDADAPERVTVDGRLDMFDDAIRKLLWPERRLLSSSYNGATPERLARDHGLIWRTPRETYLELDGKQVPAILGRNPIVMWVRAQVVAWFPWLETLRYLWLPSLVLLVISFVTLRYWAGRKWVRYLAGYVPLVGAVVVGLLLYLVAGELGNVRIGPIPAGTPVNLLANANPDAAPADLLHAVKTTVQTLSEINSKNLQDEPSKTGQGTEADRLMRERIAPALLKVSKSPDLVMDRGHDYEWFDTMTDDDKDALIELLKTF